MIDDNNNAILLLNARFSSAGNEQVSPLTPGEWGSFAEWLKLQGKRPADLLGNDRKTWLAGWEHKRLTLERIEQLLERGNAMALAMEKWSRAGIWVITRSDADYPRLLKQHLGASAPAVLYGCGNKQLLSQPAIGVVGRREADQNDQDYAGALGRNIAQQACSVVSGCARGIDEASMLGALDSEGTAIGVVGDSLMQAARARKWRDGLMSNNLVLVSPYYPDAAFSRGNAMGRNKFIYCLSQATLVVYSGKDGGTWSGAEENLKKGWVPLWVKRTADKQAGNVALVQKGGRWLPDDPLEVDIRTLVAAKAPSEAPATLFESSATGATADLLSPLMQNTDVPAPQANLKPAVKVLEPIPGEDVGRVVGNVVEQVIEASDIQPATLGTAEGLVAPAVTEEPKAPDAPKALGVPQLLEIQGEVLPEAAGNEISLDPHALGFYEFFLLKLAGEKGPFSVDQLSEKWQIPKGLTKGWLSEAESQGVVKKINKPIRYVLRLTGGEDLQTDLGF